MQKDVFIARIAVVMLLLTGWIFCLASHLHHVQVDRHEELLSKARARYTGSATERCDRGEILDVDGHLLAANLSCRDILAEPWRVGSRKAGAIRLLARELNLDAGELRERFDDACAPADRYPEIVLARAISPATARRLGELGLEGVRVRRRAQSDRGFVGRLRRILAWSGGDGSRSYDVFLRTASLRSRRARGETLRQLAPLLDRSASALEAEYRRATRNRSRPVEIVVQRGVPVQRVKRIESYRALTLTPASEGHGLLQTLRILAQELDVPPAALRAKAVNEDGSPVKGQVTLPFPVPGSAAAAIQKYRFKGVELTPYLTGFRYEESSKRFYPKGSLLANVIGFTNASGRGISGIEERCDEDLSPQYGRARFVKDRTGARLHSVPADGAEPRPGSDVFLTISEPIQQIVDDELDRLVEQFEPKAAYAVMINPQTGAFMAMAQRPTFNLNNRNNLEPRQWTNRIAEAGFEPGSVVKPLAISGAIDFGAVRLDTVFDCEQGAWRFCGKTLHDSSGHSYGGLTVAEILQHSSNIGTAKIALAMGERKLYQTLLRYGFGKRTRAGFEREATGIFRTLDRWDGLSISRFPIGQGVLTTPLQLVQAYAALANRGVMMQPYVVDRIRRPDGTVERTRPRAKGRAVRTSAACRTVAALKTVTTPEGTAPEAAIPGYEVAGKTGTAQKWVDGHYSHTRYVSTFVGFVPADNPAFVLLVTADEPKPRPNCYAGTVAAPAFRRIAEKTLRYLDIAPRTGPPAEAWQDEIAATENRSLQANAQPAALVPATP